MHEFRGTPHGARQTEGFCQAIALDCEMVRVKKGRQDVAFLSAVDFFTNKILISRYVVPSEEVVDWRSDFSGITQVIMNAAISSGAVFYNWREARDKLWEFMDDSTILVGQSLNYDLEVLGICHANIVDTAILTAEAVFSSSVPNKPLPRMWSLKTLANDFLSLEIQTSTLGHSAVEDACAAREIAIWCSRNPGKLESWAENSRIREKARKFKKKSQRHCKGSSKRNLPASQQSSRVQEHDTAYYDHSDDLRLSDLAEALGYPEDYDPWSD
ncbi:hypothetical protein N7456_006328 [Penicillium angulare]|uniref:Exonuclease domain-containing protein n=1 Tax=Penicillium angulare TaxID=116970 RepID=A0A9W9KC34_9EURO|nr:hypothetical protein N7456_006328 [Penicillium angulare]